MQTSSRHVRRITALAAGALLAGAALTPAVLAARSRTGSAPAAPAAAGRPAGRLVPPMAYAPYFETWTTDSIPALARRSGARYLTLAFLQTPRKGSCRVAWDGDRKRIVAPGRRYGREIAALRTAGGQVVPSFGGYSADQGGTEIADSCTSVSKIARAYESVVTTYGVNRLDMDVEAKSLSNRAGIARRSAAIAVLQRWAARRHRPVQIVFTLGVEPQGLTRSGLTVLRSALAHGVAVTAVNVMAFDYYNATTDSDMGLEAIEALAATHRQLGQLYPRLPDGVLWRREGITLLPGIDDFPKKTEVTYLSEAQDVLSYARARHLAMISIWALQRDRGGCPGTVDSNSCSGITQPRWAFSHLLEGRPLT